ncbi:MAG: DUF4494 domain-containing protein [Flavobacteriales bacterium]|nr:DUF4494 domain-containing protein [Flavobacteriales bacterium]
MTKNWFTCKVKYMKVDNNGNESTTTEAYLVDAVSYTEAETRIYEEMEQRVRGEFRIVNIAKANYTDVIVEEEEDLVDWYKVKVTGIEYDQEADKEKKYNNYYLISADSCLQAISRTETAMKDMEMEFVIPSVGVVQLVDVFPYNEEAGLTPVDEIEEEVIESFDPATGEVVEA